MNFYFLAGKTQLTFDHLFCFLFICYISGSDCFPSTTLQQDKKNIYNWFIII